MLVVVLLAAPALEAQMVFSDPGFVSETIAALPPFTPVGVAFVPDGRLFIWQKAGVVGVVKNGALLAAPFVDISAQTNQFGDRGLLGLALHPDFATNGFVYLLYTVEAGGDPNDGGPKTSRLSRVTADPANPDVALSGSEVVILDGIPSNSPSHSIGTVRFAPDGTMFVGSGDGAEFNFVDFLALRALDLDSLNGKILRINPDGTAPVDNPFYDGTNSNRSKVWSYGLRNPFRFSLHPVSGEPVLGDVGWNLWEEVNEGRGANFGWPCFEGNAPQPLYQPQFVECQQLPASAVAPPVYAYHHSTPDAFGVTGSTVIAGPVYTGSEYPTQYVGSLFIADYTARWIRRIIVDDDGQLITVAPFAANVDGPVALEQGPDGLLYYVALNSGEIGRVGFNGPLAQASATPTFGHSPLAVSFSSAGSRATNGGPLGYSWAFGDGTTSAAADPIHTYTAVGVAAFTATLTVTDTAGRTSSDSVRITVGSTPPSATIATPPDDTVVFPGQTIAFQGSAVDPEEGPLPGTAMTWMVLLHHNTHVHIVQTATGSQGSIFISNHGDGQFAYEIVLTARDSSGLTGTASAVLPVNPDKLLFPTALTFSPSSVEGGTPTTGTVTLSAPAPAGGAVVALSSDTPSLAVPTAVTVPQGTPTTTFPATTSAVASLATATVTATLNGLAAATVPVHPILSGRVAGYRFDEGIGTVIGDVSGSANNGILSGATWTAEGLAFDGVDDFATVPDSPTLDLGAVGAIAVRVRLDSVGRWNGVIAKGSANSDPAHNYALEVVDINLARCILGNGTSSLLVDSSITVVAGRFYHLACVWNGTTVSLYIDGELSNSVTQTLTPAGNTAPLSIGQFGGNSDRLHGTTDEVRIYSRALTQAEVQQDMTTAIGGGTAPSDTTPPTPASALAATTVSASQINLAWTGSTDNVGVTGYHVERCQDAACTNFTPITTTTGPGFDDA
ncbi:MAG: PQQ-dependent sugar dehydrogenase, partial [Candidatus Rokuibacteriota bacterium]